MMGISQRNEHCTLQAFCDSAYPIRRSSCLRKLLKSAFRVLYLPDDWAYCGVSVEGAEQSGLP